MPLKSWSELSDHIGGRGAGCVLPAGLLHKSPVAVVAVVVSAAVCYVLFKKLAKKRSLGTVESRTTSGRCSNVTLARALVVMKIAAGVFVYFVVYCPYVRSLKKQFYILRIIRRRLESCQKTRLTIKSSAIVFSFVIWQWEKLLKAIVVMQTDAPVEYTHSLLRLAELAKMDLTVDKIENIKTITKFNIAGRYEDEKWEFRKLATREYTEKYVAVAEELILWLKHNYLKK